VLNLTLAAVVLASAVTAYLLFFRTDQPAASATRPSVAVARGEVTASVSSSGTLQSSQTASPQFETSGTVTQIMVKVGQVVAKGTAIAKIDPASADRQLRMACNLVGRGSAPDEAMLRADGGKTARSNPGPGTGQMSVG
jgi:membrane fusion protein, macrolide-specific efflux system